MISISKDYPIDVFQLELSLSTTKWNRNEKTMSIVQDSKQQERVHAENSETGRKKLRNLCEKWMDAQIAIYRMDSAEDLIQWNIRASVQNIRTGEKVIDSYAGWTKPDYSRQLKDRE